MNKQIANLLEQHFDTAFSAPDGIKKLRELILTLAMQGKLVEQDPNDQPASELLKEIEAEKQQLVTAGKIKKPKSLSAIVNEEMPHKIPSNWAWVRFGDIAQHNSGKTLDKGRNTGQPREYITTSNLYWGKFELENVRQMLIREDELEKCTAKKDDLLICEGGEAGRAAVWPFDSEVCFQNHIHRARFYKDIDPYFVYRFFEKLSATGEINQHRKGVGISNMSSKALASIVFPLPPLLEQYRIVARIDQLMARCEELEKLRNEREEKRLAVHAAAIKQLLDAPDGLAWNFIQQYFGELYTVKENVAELRKAILQLAVMGRLVPQYPNDLPASELLKEIEVEKQRLVKEGKIKQPKPIAPIKPEEMPYEMPNGWEWVRFGDLTTEIATGPFGSMIHKSDYVFDGIPLINPSHMIDGKIVQDQSISVSKKMAKTLSSYKLCENDIVMARRGEVGRCAVVNNLSDGFLCGTGSFVLRFIDKLNRQYILNMFKTENIQEYLGVNSVGTTMTNLNHNILNNMPVLLPPLPEQYRIVARIDQFMALCDQLDQQIDAVTSKQTELLNAVLAQL